MSEEKTKDGGVDFAAVLLYVGERIPVLEVAAESMGDKGFIEGRLRVLNYFKSIVAVKTGLDEVGELLREQLKKQIKERKEFHHQPGINHNSIQERQKITGSLFELETILRGLDQFKK